MMDIEAEKKTVQEFVDKGNFHAAVNIAISALNECRRNNDQAGTDHFPRYYQRNCRYHDETVWQ